MIEEKKPLTIDKHHPTPVVMNVCNAANCPVPDTVIQKIVALTGDVLEMVRMKEKKKEKGVKMTKIAKAIGAATYQEFKHDDWRFHIQLGHFPDMLPKKVICHHTIWIRYDNVNFIVYINKVKTDREKRTVVVEYDGKEYKM